MGNIISADTIELGSIDPGTDDNSGNASSDGHANNINGIDTFDFANADSGTDNGTGNTDDRAGNNGATGKRRGRPPGGRNGTRAANRETGAVQKNKTNLNGVENILLSIHTMGAAMFSVPELLLEPSEAKALADGIGKVAEFYPTTVNPKLMAWSNLLIIMGGVYGTRFFAIKNRVKKELGPQLVKQATPKPPTQTAEPKPPPYIPVGVDLHDTFGGGLH